MRRQWLRRIGGIIILAAAIGGGTEILKHPSPPPVAGGLTANFFVTATGVDNPTNCSRSGSAVAFASYTAGGALGCHSAQYVCQNAQAGDTVRFEPSATSYGTQTLRRQDCPTTSPGVTFTVDGAAQSVTTGSWVLGTNTSSCAAITPSYVTIRDFYIPQGTIADVFNITAGCGSQSNNATSVHVFNNVIHCASGCIGAGVLACHSCTDFQAVGNTISDICCQIDGIRPVEVSKNADGQPNNILIANNYIHDLYDSCTLYNGKPGTAGGPPCSGSGFSDPACQNATPNNCAHVDGIQDFGGCDTCTWSGNVIGSINTGSLGSGQGIFSSACGLGSACAFRNLTFVNNAIGALPSAALNITAASVGSVSGFVHLYNNSMVGSILMYKTAFAPGTSIIATNNTASIIGNNNNACNTTDSTGTTLSITYSHNLTSSVTCSSDIHGSPGFVDASANTPNQHLSSSSSAAANAGDDSICGFGNPVATDATGLARIVGAHCDIGAYEDF